MGCVNIGVIIIGRNEGDRLVRALKSTTNSGIKHGVYVDSGSSDNSINHAKQSGLETISLDLSRPFTAARARNTGFQQLIKTIPNVEFIQFLDGDCTLAADWIKHASQFLADNPNHSIVAGRLREISPEASVYNQLCDLEWDTPVGPSKACGGIFMARRSAFESVQGFDEHIIAGEEPELCYRMRAQGWLIERLDFDMARHDAAMTRFSQWWKRMRRSGYAFMHGALKYGMEAERYNIRPVLRICFWASLLPLILLLAASVGPWALLALSIYPLQIMRLALLKSPNNHPMRWTSAYFRVLGQFPEFIGLIDALFDHITRRNRPIIEYK